MTLQYIRDCRLTVGDGSSVLDLSRLVTTEKVGRVRTCKLGLSRLAEETAWIEKYRQLWASRFDELDKIVEELKQKEKFDGRR